MFDSPGANVVLNQLNALLKVPILPKGSFPTTSDQNVGPLSDEDEMIRNHEFRQLEKATEPLKCSDAVPQTTEIETIQHFQKKCASDVSQHDDYIQHLQLRINSLLEEIQATRTRQMQIQNLSDYFKPICSSLRRLPPEILITIFQMRLSSDSGPQTGAPLVLCHISLLWRRVALESQPLWSRLSIKFGQISDSQYDAISKFWFSNAGNQPRSVYYDHMEDNSRLPTPERLSEDLKTSSRLIRTLKCTNILPQLLIPFLQLPSADVPLLEVVHLVSATECTEVITVLEAAPSLRVVHLDMHSPLLRIELPWSRLTHLKIQDAMDAEHWTVVFTQCVRLQRGSFYVLFPLVGNFGLATQATLEHLEALFLIIEDEESLFEGFFQSLNLPRLRHFSLTNSFFESDPLMPFRGPIRCPKLESLCFQGIRIGKDDFTSLFTATPALQNLALDISSLDYSFPPLLHRNSTLLPALSNLYLVTTHDDMMLQPSVGPAITSRLSDSSPSSVSLKRLLLFLQSDEESEDEDDADLKYMEARKLREVSAMIMRAPNSGDLEFGVRMVPKYYRLGEVVELFWGDQPQEY